MKLETPQGPVSASLHGPEGAPRLVLTHGAGGSKDTPGLVRFAEACADRGLEVIRFNQPSAEAGKGRPDPAKRVELTWRQIVEQTQGAPKLVIGGRSFGGRMASHIVAQGAAVDGLLFLGYPLHPPGKPEQIRDAHLSQIEVPMLFIQGSRDPFATPELLHATIEGLPSATLHLLDGGNHSLEVKGRPNAEVIDEIADRTIGWLGTLS
ncbi:MAG: alpha/beta family hydrolase [Actinomycetota bacterium]